ncbi:MAG TPA: bifunctional diguanylate cyclase/phosphodiesterase [Rhizobacter sp.]|nr:bifunctional diguanylate cyclase/phosphodiesterase [Rhizobacter sp.]
MPLDYTNSLVFSSAVNLIVGLTLLLAWWRDPRQVFSRDLGWAYLTQICVPLAYWMMRQPQQVTQLLGVLVVVTASALYIALVILGSARLAGFVPTRRQSAVMCGALLVVGLVLINVDPRLAQALSASLHIAAGIVAMGWLWRLGPGERLVGILLVMVGANQFIFVVAGEGGLGLQLTIAAVLRLTLGLSLLHAAVTRSLDESRRLRQRFQQLTERSHQGVAVVQGEELTYANPALLRIYGLSSLSEVNTLWREATMPEAERAAARERHRRIIAGELVQASWDGLRYRFDGTPIHLRFTAWRIDWDGTPAEQVVVTDETAQHNATQALLHQATHDELTGLPNRSALLQRLRQLCAQPDTAFALVLLDVDRFKLFNEAHGHAVGDEVLRALAATLQQAVNGEAEVMRLGEDEFALLARSANDEASANALVQRVRKRLSRSLTVLRHEFYLDVSMGVALHPGTTRDPEALLRAANAAMRQAKATPGTSLQFAQERFEQGSGEVLDAEQALRAGVTKDEFVLFYQPKVDALSGKAVGFEALVRWDRPGLGRIGPNEFIPAAERTGLIVPLGRLILAQACQQQARWREAGASLLPVAVNVSPLQLLDPAFPEMVANTLRQYEVPPALLTLEITESAAVTHLEQASQQIRELRANGVAVALDDFGTGFSSLNLLRSLPVNTVKIDRTLIDPLPAPDARAVVQAICTLAAVLRLDVVAEGVETEAQAEAARNAGCQVLQGALYAAPLTVADATQWLQRRESSVAP